MSIDQELPSATLNEAPVDVCIVGAGPVGMILALDLQNRNKELKIAIYERQPAPYPLPRAVCLDHESLRLLYTLGLGPQVEAIIHPWPNFTWRDAEKKMIVDLGWKEMSVSGHHNTSGFSQPQLERLLEAAVVARGIKIERGWSLQYAESDASSVTAHFNRWTPATGPDLASARTLEAKYVVGCDGANSTVRKLTGIAMVDLGFTSDWLIVDIIPVDPKNLPKQMTEHGPHQLCDPMRPTTVVHGGPGRERIEYMRLPGETIEDLPKKENVWRVMNKWGLTAENCELERTAVYTFHARWAESLQSGRFFLAGDSAHLMPPFIGQGMNSGIRDAAALAWRLDAVLSGRFQPSVFDSYSNERLGHVEQVTRLAVKLGKAICVTSADEAAVLHAHLRSEPQPVIHYRLGGPGLFIESQPSAGLLSLQRKILNSASELVWVDTIADSRWTLLSTRGSPLDVLSSTSKKLLEKMGGTSIDLKGRDTTGAYAKWFEEECGGAEVVLIRPDFYVAFGCKFSDLEETFGAFAAGVGLV